MEYLTSKLEEVEFVDLDDSDLDESQLVETLVESADPHSVLTKEVFDSIVAYVKAGSYFDHAASACGIEQNTFNGWVRRGLHEPDSIYGLFRTQMMKAYGMSAIRNEVSIQQAAATDWKAAAWILSKRYPEVYGKDKVSVELSGPDGSPLRGMNESKIITVISRDELKKMMVQENAVDELNTIQIEDEIYLEEENKQ